MKAISLHQPHASAIAQLLKPYETRHWPCPASLIGQPLAIHAAKKQHWSLTMRWIQHKLGLPLDPNFYPDMLDLDTKRLTIAATRDYEALPFGAVVCLVKVLACHKIDADFLAKLTPTHALWGDFTIGRYAWEVKVFYVFDKPIPTMGKQGFFNWEIPDEWMKKAADEAGMPGMFEIWKAVSAGK